MKTFALTTYEASLQCKDTEHIATLRGSVVNTIALEGLSEKIRISDTTRR